MKHVLIFALVGCLTLCGAASPSESSPGRAVSDMASHTRALPVKQATTSARTASTRAISAVRHHVHKQYTRVVLDVTGRVAIRKSKDNRHATISLLNVTLSQRARRQINGTAFPRAIVIAPGDKQTINIVLDLRALRKYRVLPLQQPDRVVVDLFYAPNVAKTPVKPDARASKPSTTTRPEAAQSSPPPSNTPPGILIVIDPGHGGRDPGTTGRMGTREKTIVLQISKYLRALLQERLKAKVLLTRSKDVFLDLEKRVKFANQKKLDWCGKDMGSTVEAKKKSRICLFVSIHVNAHPRKSIKGLEVYHFGKASDPRALRVAARENGMKLESDTPPWQFIITDNLNDHKIKQSQTFARTTSDVLVTTLRKNYKVKNHGVKTAPFYVLRFTTMPSILAEVGFISNATEEKRLKTQTFQKKLAEGMYQGIRAYLKAL